MGDSIIQDTSFLGNVMEIWNKFDELHEPVAERFMILLAQTNAFFTHQSALKLQQCVQKGKMLRRTLISLQRLQEGNPHCQWIESQLCQERAELCEMEQSQADYTYYKNAAKWVQVGDKVTKEFFNITMPRFMRAPIQALKDVNGNIVTEKSE